MLVIKAILILLLFIAAGSSVPQTSKVEPPEKLTSVCDILSNRGVYNGRLVALIGRWVSTDEGSWIESDCEKPIKTGSYTWSDIIFLNQDSSSPTIFAKHISFDFATADSKIAELTAHGKLPNEKVRWAVVYGLLETKEELETAFSADGSARGVGYGHLNASPAQIIYREKDLFVLPR